MDRPLTAGTLLDCRFRITEAIGHTEESAGYLAADLDKGGSWTLVWEAVQLFQMLQKEGGLLGYLAQDNRPDLILQLEGKDVDQRDQACKGIRCSPSALKATRGSSNSEHSML
jgi:hypothetical protein